MCTHSFAVNNRSLGTSLLVSCGRCFSCQQEKVTKRISRINNNTPVFHTSPNNCYFITLSYSDNYIPYIKRSEYDAFINGSSVSFNVYRDNNINVRSYERELCEVKEIKTKENGYQFLNADGQILKSVTYYDQQIIGKFDVYNLSTPDYIFVKSDLKDDNFTHLHSKVNGMDIYDAEKIGVLWQPDIQNFFKKLNKRLPFSLNYFYVSEYGSNTKRPHYHILLYAPKSYGLEQIKNAVCESWLFHDWDQLPRAFEISVHPEKYLSGYVNKCSHLPSLFQICSKMRSKHKTSQDFGMAVEDFTYSEICKKIDKRDLSITRTIIKEGVPAICSLPVPKYVVNRYFPYFKGYRRFNFTTLVDFLYGVAEITESPDVIKANNLYNRFKDIGLWFYEDFEKIFVHQRNLFRRLQIINLSQVYDYANYYWRSWIERSNFFHRQFYNNLSSDMRTQLMEYWNINDYVSEWNLTLSTKKPKDFLSLLKWKKSFVYPRIVDIYNSLPRPLPRSYNDFPSVRVRSSQAMAEYISYQNHRALFETIDYGSN